MSTTKPPAPGKRPLAERLAEIEQLRIQLVAAVLSPDCAFSSIPTITEIRNRWSTLKEKAAELESRGRALQSATQEYRVAESQAKAASNELSNAEAGLQSHAPELGRAAFGATKNGLILLHPAFEPRMAAERRIAGLRKQYDDLAAPGGSFLAGVKAKAQQVAIQGQIKFAEFNLRAIEKEAGRQIIVSGHEDALACADTTAILQKLRSARDHVQKCQANLDEATKVLQTRKNSISQEFGLTGIVNISSLHGEAKRCGKLRSNSVEELHTSEANIPTTLLSQADCQDIPQIKDLLTRLKAAMAEPRNTAANPPATAAFTDAGPSQEPGIGPADTLPKTEVGGPPPEPAPAFSSAPAVPTSPSGDGPSLRPLLSRPVAPPRPAAGPGAWALYFMSNAPAAPPGPAAGPSAFGPSFRGVAPSNSDTATISSPNPKQIRPWYKNPLYKKKRYWAACAVVLIIAQLVTYININRGAKTGSGPPDARPVASGSNDVGLGSGTEFNPALETPAQYFHRLNPTNSPVIDELIKAGGYTTEMGDRERRMEENTRQQNGK